MPSKMPETNEMKSIEHILRMPKSHAHNFPTNFLNDPNNIISKRINYLRSSKNENTMPSFHQFPSTKTPPKSFLCSQIAIDHPSFIMPFRRNDISFWPTSFPIRPFPSNIVNNTIGKKAIILTSNSSGNLRNGVSFWMKLVPNKHRICHFFMLKF